MKRSDVGWVSMQFGLIAGLLLSPRGPARFAPAWLPEVFALGVALVVVAPSAARLGRGFTAAPSPREVGHLAEDGLHRWVRHPMYSALLASTWLFALAGWSPLRLAFAVFLTIFFHLKARHEERLLEDRYAGYRDYMERVPRFLPRLPR